jgi:hypothetical protein
MFTFTVTFPPSTLIAAVVEEEVCEHLLPSVINQHDLREVFEPLQTLINTHAVYVSMTLEISVSQDSISNMAFVCLFIRHHRWTKR